MALKVWQDWVLVKTTRFIVNFLKSKRTLFTWARKEIQTERNGGYYLNNPIFRIDYSKFCNGLFTIVQKKIWCAIMGTILKDEL
jgi:hypothetical protein